MMWTGKSESGLHVNKFLLNAGPPKPKRKYTRRSDKWKIKKTKPLNSDDEDEQMPGGSLSPSFHTKQSLKSSL